MLDSTITVQPKPRQLITWIEHLRAISIIAVISIHTIYSALLLFGDSSLDTNGTMVYRSAMNMFWWGVPCFLMITGFLLLNPEKEISYCKVFKQYIPRILGVLILFGTAYAEMELLFVERLISVKQIGIAFFNVFQGETWAHMWYLYCLLGLYFLLPVYKILSKHMTDKDLKYYLFISFAFLSVLPLCKMFGIESGFYIHVASIYPFWIFVGLAERRQLISMRYTVSFFWGSSVLIIASTVIRYRCDYDGMDQLFGYNSPLVVVQAIALFELVKKSHLVGVVSRVLTRIGGASFGIYIVHMVFVNIFYKLIKLNPFANGGYTVVVLVLLVLMNLILSYTITVILKRLPVFRKLL